MIESACSWRRLRETSLRLVVALQIASRFRVCLELCMTLAFARVMQSFRVRRLLAANTDQPKRRNEIEPAIHKPALGVRTAMPARIWSRELPDKAVRPPVLCAPAVPRSRLGPHAVLCRSLRSRRSDSTANRQRDGRWCGADVTLDGQLWFVRSSEHRKPHCSELATDSDHDTDQRRGSPAWPERLLQNHWIGGE